MREKIFYAFNLDDFRADGGRSDTKVSVRLVAARSREKAKAFLAQHYGGQAWAVVSHRDLNKGLVRA
ncbi:hypothetical protein SAMN02745206_01564 [Desulfacinum infernum DSM 9756]|jgi:hypothetical protein|uniref:Uncharacterized protein n=1 Tax=Desulfacinum infernum DSM 9756 TaxID=1121391 RepID=A0A1M4ZY31_9BACT|nr:hypothetical protein [Desulfacinum infernum]MBC7359830.1 hypothetical protein [Desulfacinum sp.]MBZ4659164.1 hypothetical protein [Desulfacinum sp.]SHF22602.1 hypothetical protein SAMN02745206_01564 [Desulfacinum infernum DSM 9756]